MATYLIIVTDPYGGLPAPDASREASKIVVRGKIRKHYSTCYADTSMTVIRCDESLSDVANTVAGFCDKAGVACMVAAISPETLFVHGINLSKCFDGNLRFRTVDPLSPGVTILRKDEVPG